MALRSWTFPLRSSRALQLLVVTALCGAVSSCFLLSRPAGKLWIFVTNFGDDTVSVIDGDLDREVQVIKVGHAPQALAARARDPLVAVANRQGGTITLIDPVKRAALTEGVHVPLGPEDVVFTVDGRQLITNSYYEKTVTFVDVATRTAVGSPLSFAVRPRRLKVSPDGTRLYALLYDPQGAVAVIDLATRGVIATVPVGKFPTDFALTPDGRTLFAASFDDQKVTAIDTVSLKSTATYQIETGFGLLVHPTRPLLYSMLSFEDEVLVFDYATGKTVANVDVGTYPVYSAITPDGRYLYVVNEDANNLTKVDTATNTKVEKIAVGTQPGAAVALVAPH